MSEVEERKFQSQLLVLLPLVVFLVVGGFLFKGLFEDPRKLPNMLEGEPVPPFQLAPLKGRDDKGFAAGDLQGDVSLVNVFGSWCVACRVEHPFLMELKKQNAVPIHGIDWREKDADAGPAWLAEHGDPYTLAGDDPHSKAAISFGVTGAPETFVVDKQGIIRFKQVGPVTKEVWEETLKPMIEHLRKQAKP